MKRSHLFTAAAGAVAAMASPAYALNVGEARVLSFTDQPLRVLIPIKAQGWEWRAMWASAQTYQVGLGLTATLYKPTGERTEGVIEIRSKAPITEPIVDLQITFETGHRTTVHRTPILIDVQQQTVSVAENQAAPVPQNPLAPYQRSAAAPSQANVPAVAQPQPVYPVAPAAPVAQAPRAVPAPVAPAASANQGFATYPKNGPFPEVQAVVEPTNEHVRASSYQPPPEFAPASARASQGNGIPVPPSLANQHGVSSSKPARSNQGAGEGQYVVKSGDGLHSIASKHKPALWSTEEAMVHIYKSNRQAFAGSAYNTLKAGAVLTFAWDGAPQQTQARTLPKSGTAFPELRAPENFAEPRAQYTPAPSSSFTENDARAAVLRHRMIQIQQELNALQSGRTR